MEIVMRKVSELTPYDKNAKKHHAKQAHNPDDGDFAGLTGWFFYEGHLGS